MTRPYRTVGSLAEALRLAREDLRVVRRDVEDLIAALYPGWRPRFPSDRAWRFTDPDQIDVFDAIESPAATDALHRAGFKRVTAHDHPRSDSCQCRTSVEPQPPTRKRATRRRPTGGQSS